MNTQTTAPMFPARPGVTNPKPYPDPDTKLGAAWQSMWRKIRASTDPVQGVELAHAVAPKHGLQPATLIVLLSRAAKAGILDREVQTVQGTRGVRPRTYYTIAR